MRTICLNMIVKDEKEAIESCLSSIKNLIDYWVIVDTGSTDGTQDIIRAYLKDIPGELHERPWVDFGHNRNEALALAKGKGSYLLFIDADETLNLHPHFIKPSLDKDCYYAFVQTQTNIGQRILLINNEIEWQWKGVLHESIVRPYVRSLEVLTNLTILATSDEGARAKDPKKHHKDAELLEQALQKEPMNSRYVFYLAQSYVNAHEYALALKNYEKRSTMGETGYEVFWSLYSIGMLQQQLGMDLEMVLKSFQKAHEYRKDRAEPIYRLAKIHHQLKNDTLAYNLLKTALAFPLPLDTGYIEHWIYDFGLLLVLADCAQALGKYQEAEAAYQQLLLKNTLPSLAREEIKKSLILTSMR